MRKAKFTLIELLVVVAIIGVLMSMLIPSLRKARLATKTTLSMNNLKQIYISVNTYVDSNNGFLFTTSENAHPCDSNPKTNWSRMVYEEMIGERLPLSSGQSQPLMVAGTAYWNLMFCKILRETREPTRGPKLGGSDYSMNRHFQNENRMFDQLEGKEEPFIAPGTTGNGNMHASHTLKRGDFSSTQSGTLVYKYTNNKTFALFINGGVKFLSKPEGVAVDADINNGNDFK